MPRRAEEIIDGGSMYWVVAGAVLVRQRIIGIIRDEWDDGSLCAGLLLDPALVRVAARSMKAFQGWRYLNAADAPADISAAAAGSGIDALPEEMRAALARLALV